MGFYSPMTNKIPRKYSLNSLFCIMHKYDPFGSLHRVDTLQVFLLSIFKENIQKFVVALGP